MMSEKKLEVPSWIDKAPQYTVGMDNRPGDKLTFKCRGDLKEDDPCDNYMELIKPEFISEAEYLVCDKCGNVFDIQLPDKKAIRIGRINLKKI